MLYNKNINIEILNMPKKKTTIDDLAIIMEKGFKKHDEMFKKQDERFKKQDERFKKQDEKFKKQDERFKKQDEKFDDLTTVVEKGFKKHDKMFKEQNENFDNLVIIIKDSFENQDKRIDKKFEQQDKKIDGLKTTMVTKDYLDEKMADLRGDLAILIRKEDTKLKALINILSKRKVISSSDQEKIYSMEPFPELKLGI